MKHANYLPLEVNNTIFPNAEELYRIIGSIQITLSIKNQNFKLMKAIQLKSKSLIFIMILSTLATSCEKDELPRNCCDCTAPASTSGRNVLSFDLDGKTWSPCNAVNPDGKAPEILAERYRLFGYDRITIKATQQFENAGKNDNLFIIIDYPKLGKINPNGTMIPIGIINLSVLSDRDQRYLGQYNSHKDLPFSLEVTRFDTINRIISGVFSADLYKTGTLNYDTISITNGRFDVHYN